MERTDSTALPTQKVHNVDDPTHPTVDYAAAMRRVIDQHTSDGPYVPRVAASEIVDKLRATDPDLLAGWLNEQAETFVWQAINDRDRSRRSHATQSARPRAFKAASDRAAEGDPTPLRRFLDSPYTVADGSRRPLAQLTRDDLTFVADDYTARAEQNQFKAAFMKALARKVKTGVVADHFTEEQVAAMWSGLAA